MFHLNTFESRAQLDQIFATQVANLLKIAIATKGQASIAVSGGSTPKAFFNALSKEELAWHKVIITLADERWVDEHSDASNTRLVKAHLLQNNAALANFFELKIADQLDQNTLAQLNKHAEETLLPFDVLILGMGEDGHTASLFPCSEQISTALSLTNHNSLMKVQPRTAPYQRITFTLSSLLKSKAVFLHICGENKYQVLQQALVDALAVETMPIRAFLHHKTLNTQVMFAN